MPTTDVLKFPDRLLVQGDALRLPFADQSVDLCFGSPPYVDARLYLESGVDLKISRDCKSWVEWMLKATTEALRVSRGAVVWIASGVTRDRNYWPACEGLMWEWYARGLGHAYRPCYWHRVGIPGSGGDQWFRADVEYAMCFMRHGKLPWSDNTVMGHPPKWGPGGEMSHRLTDGTRRNQWGGGEKSSEQTRRDGSRQPAGRPSHKMHTKREANGEMRDQAYAPPTLANPGSVIKSTVGGGHMGSKLSHENEAPFPEGLAEHFIRSLCPPGGTVLDCFSGSATTVAAALKHGRRGVGLDLRRSQCELGIRRVKECLSGVPAPRKETINPTQDAMPLFGW